MELPLALPYEEFAEGMRLRIISCHFVGEASEFLTVPQKKRFAVLVILHTFAPFVLVPLWAYHERSWWLLLGIPAAMLGLFLGTRASVQGPKATSGGFLPFILVVLFFAEGFRSRDFFYALCATWSWAFFLIADDAQRGWAQKNLVANRDTYERAVADERVVIISKKA